MITKFKIFENLNEQPKVGDYVLLNVNVFPYENEITADLIMSKIGKITEIKHNLPLNQKNTYIIKFNIDSTFFDKEFNISHFKYWSSSKEELEAMIASNKYNL